MTNQIPAQNKLTPKVLHDDGVGRTITRSDLHLLSVRFFPHDVSDLPLVIKYMNSAESVKVEDAWALRYIVMLWLSLVCMLPFDLKQFDEERSTASSLENIGLTELTKCGERLIIAKLV